MKLYPLWVLAIVLTGCGYTYIYSPKSIRVTSPNAKVVLTDTDSEAFSENISDSTTSNTTKDN